MVEVKSYDIYRGDCLKLMPALDTGSVDLMVADPPWGIDWDGYEAYSDDLAPEAYLAWCRDWMSEVWRLVSPVGSFWLAISHEFVSELDVLAKSLGFRKRHQIAQYATFGVASTKNFARSHSYWLYYTKHKTKFTFNAADPELRVPSARALKYNDRRANPAGKLPDSVWVLHPDEMIAQFDGTQDVWFANRLPGNAKERVFKGTYGEEKVCPQMPLEVMKRIIRTSSNPGDVVLDPFSGTFATGDAAVRLGRNFVGCELSENYCDIGEKRLAVAFADWQVAQRDRELNHGE